MFKRTLALLGAVAMVVVSLFFASPTPASAQSDDIICANNLSDDYPRILEGDSFLFSKRTYGEWCNFAFVPDISSSKYPDIYSDGWAKMYSYTWLERIPEADKDYYKDAKENHNGYLVADLSICENFTAYFLAYEGNVCELMDSPGDTFFIEDWQGVGTLYNLDNAKLYEAKEW